MPIKKMKDWSWNEQAALSDRNPALVIKNLSQDELSAARERIFCKLATKQDYLNEFESISGQQLFLNAAQNYDILAGMKANLYKCFLPKSWELSSKDGICAFVHPEGVYDDPKGGKLRNDMYIRLRSHFQFSNELKLFREIDHHTVFGLNVYGKTRIPAFDSISNLYDVKTIAECYEDDRKTPIPGIKNEQGEWNIAGHPERILKITKRELTVFAKLFDGKEDWRSARLPSLHVRTLVDVLVQFADQEHTYSDFSDSTFGTVMWSETNAVKDGTNKREPHFPDSQWDMIYSGPHFSIGNPIFKASRRVCIKNSM